MEKEIKKEKYHLNVLNIILGTKCNMQCRHCCGGDITKHLELDLNCIENLIPDIYGIDTLAFIGYETTLYIDKMKQVFNMLIDNNIKINKIGIKTNAKIYSQKLVDFLKYAKNYVTSPQQSVINISVDKFHFENENNKKLILANLDRYKKELSDICSVIEMNLTELFLMGRAKQLTREETQDIDNIYTYQANTPNNIEIIKVCQGKQNTCNNGNCVKNCIVTDIVLTPNGYIFCDSVEQAYQAITDNNYKNAMGNILNISLKDMIENYQKINTSEPSYIKIKVKNDAIWQMDYILFKIVKYKEQFIKNFLEKNIKNHYEIRKNFNDEILSKPLPKCNNDIYNIYNAIKLNIIQHIKLCSIINIAIGATIKEIPNYDSFKNLIEFENNNCIMGIEHLFFNYEIWLKKWESYEKWDIDTMVDCVEYYLNEIDKLDK